MTNDRKNLLRVNFDLRSNFSVIWVVQSFVQKHFAGSVGQINDISSPHLIPEEGRIAIVTKRGMGCGGRDSVGREMCSQGGFP